MLGDITDEGGTTRSLSQITTEGRGSSYGTAFSHKVNMLGDIKDEGGTTRSLSQITNPKVEVVAILQLLLTRR